MQGWVSIHRKFKEWEWYDDSKVVHLFLHCLMNANHKPKKWRGIQIEPGQFITSRDKLSSELPLTIQQVRTALNKLKSTGEITIKTTTKYSMISITNWNEYQNNNHPDNQQVTNKQPTSNQQVTTNNNDNNEDNGNKKTIRKKIELDYSSWPSMPDQQILDDWLAMRKRLKADVSQTVINQFGKQLAIAISFGYSIDDCLSECVTRNWRGFKFEWLENTNKSNSDKSTSNAEIARFVNET